MKKAAFMIVFFFLYLVVFGQKPADFLEYKNPLRSALDTLRLKPSNGMNSMSVSSTELIIPMSSGWNWFSLNIEDPDMSPGNILSNLSLTEGDYIKSLYVSATYFDGFGWFGDLSELDVTETYKIKLASAGDLQFEGLEVDPETTPTAINPGWNWISFLPQESLPIGDALSSLNPIENDYIKNQSVSATYFEGYGWFGDLTEMEPGEGYMLNSGKAGIINYSNTASPTFTDTRDGHIYEYVHIGSQTWMSENLAYLPSVSEIYMGSIVDPQYYIYDYDGTDVEEAKSLANFETYGVLYNWRAALTACPSGWHLPTGNDWSDLTDFLGDNPGYQMKSISGWDYEGNGDNLSGFNALPAGHSYSGHFNKEGERTYYWSTSTEEPEDHHADYLSLRHNSNGTLFFLENRSEGYSVRCILGDPQSSPYLKSSEISNITKTSAMGGGEIWYDGGAPVTERGVCWNTSVDPSIADNKTVDDSGTGTYVSSITSLTKHTKYYIRAYASNIHGTSYGKQLVFFTEPDIIPFTDSRDGREYHYVMIGSQAWMTDNLAYIPEVSGPDVSAADYPHYYVYDYFGEDVLSAKATANYESYGVLYNWQAARTSCPDGWHLPSRDETHELKAYLQDRAGFKMKSTSGWLNDGNGDNSCGFNGLPGGSCSSDFYSLNEYGYFWTSTPYIFGINDAYSFTLDYSSDETNWYGDKTRRRGLSVRCVMGDEPPGKPFVSTHSVSGITSTTATVNGEVWFDSDDPVTDRGICWTANSLEIPTIESNKNSEGSGTGLFTSEITGLEEHQYYRVRTYAANSFGTSYGSLKNFWTEYESGTFPDTRDGQEYDYKWIGSQKWMVENLKHLPSVYPSSNGSDYHAFHYVYDYEGISVDDAKAHSNYEDYGVLYNYIAASTACPDGWHMPTNEEWITLTDFIGSDAGSHMKTTTGWYNDGNGDNSSGFNGVPGGYRTNSATITGITKYSIFWSSSSYDTGRNKVQYLYHGYSVLTQLKDYHRTGLSLRCIQDE